MPSGLSVPRPVRLTCVVAAAAFAATAFAAVPVEDSRPAERPSQPATTQAPRQAEPDNDTGGGLGSLYYELQVLQDEVRRLNGVVEEQNHRIEKLSREHRERYIELDQRLLELRQGRSVEPAAGPVATDDPSATPAVAAQGGVDASPATEREAYNAAITIVSEARPLPAPERRPSYEQALAMFQDMIKSYPNGEFTPNAYYWIGEVQLALEEVELARQAFAQVVLLYHDHAKVPDALYKLGEVYHRLGETQRSRDYLDRVIRQHPATTAAGLARAYLSELP